MALPKVCVIGAGSSGITMIKALSDRQIPFDCFEKSDQVGGNWCIRNSNNMSAAYESLHINTDARMMEYRDFPMPADTPDYPSHFVIKQYFDRYVDHFDLRRRISFGTSVEHAERAENGVWTVRLSTGEIREYDALVVANGHHWDPLWPTPYPGKFDGLQMHAHEYVSPTEPHDLRNRNIVVVGMGNSAMDISCELSRPGIARRLFLSHRNGVWVLPKYLFGIPATRLALQAPRWIPWWAVGKFLTATVGLVYGTPWSFGLKKPDHKMFTSHPTVSQDIFHRLGCGDILPRAGIAELQNDSIKFTDGQCEKVDTIIWCTGYKVSFPFFDKQFLAAPDNDLPLWHRTVKPGLNNLFFVGLMQPLGAIMPIAEAQGKMIGDYLTGEIAFPPEQEMNRQMQAERSAMFKRYLKAARHTMQVDFNPFLHQLSVVAKQGRKLASRQGNRPPVPALATNPARAVKAGLRLVDETQAA